MNKFLMQAVAFFCLATFLGLFFSVPTFAAYSGANNPKMRKLTNDTTDEGCYENGGCWAYDTCWECNDQGGSDNSSNSETSTSHETEYEEHNSGSTHHGGGGGSDDGQDESENAYSEEDREEKERLTEECENLLEDMSLSCHSKICMMYASCALADGSNPADCFAEAACYCSSTSDGRENNGGAAQYENITLTEDTPLKNSGKVDPYSPIRWNNDFYGVESEMNTITKNKGSELPKGEWQIKAPLPVSQIISQVIKATKDSDETTPQSANSIAGRNAVEYFESMLAAQKQHECEQSVAEFYNDQTGNADSDAVVDDAGGSKIK